MERNDFKGVWHLGANAYVILKIDSNAVVKWLQFTVELLQVVSAGTKF